jgi:two-component system sensor histidine kinase KdpD
MLWLDGQVDLSNLALLLVMSSALATLWLPVVASLALNAVAVLAFNWLFVPPRGTFHVDLHQHATLLVALLVVNWIVAGLLAAQQRQARHARRLAAQTEQLRTWGDRLRDAADPLVHAGALHETLADLVGGQVSLLILRDTPPPHAAPEVADDQSLRVGEPDADQLAGLWHCQRQGQAMGPGTGRHQELPEWYLPMRGRGACLGAALLQGQVVTRADDDTRAHAQALCDQMGLALQRMQLAREEARTREQAQTQAVRNALLAAISHDYRTPLATIMGAASSLESQSERLSEAQRSRLAHSIVEETEQLSRLTDNTLQLARLDAPGVALRCDWESAEEIVGAALRRVRRRDPGRRVRARLEPGLPLLWCDGLLLSQMLDNLVDNALKYSPEGAPVEILVRQLNQQVLLAVRDRGPGVAPAWRERVFEVFHRGGGPAGAGQAATVVPAIEAPSRRGAGVGLAVCRAIARAHGGDLKLRPRGHGGSSFECALPVKPAPAPPQAEAQPASPTELPES